MLVQSFNRVAFVTASLILLVTLFLLFHAPSNVKLTLPPTFGRHSINPEPQSSLDNKEVRPSSHQEVHSVSTLSKGFFPIDFGTEEGFNPSIIPHPSLENTWIVVAQHRRNSSSKSVWFTELTCNAIFERDALKCVSPPTILPIAATSSDNCQGDLEYFSWNIGPHDARVFYGPKGPYTIYGSNSGYTCFGQWIQDFRMLVEWGGPVLSDDFRMATEVQRPDGYGAIEKNWFLFWDEQGQAYVHYDIAPKRSFARLSSDGGVGQDLAPLAALNDERCMASFMPQVAPQLESIHQASNSLSITLCARSDPSCEPNESNTFILTIFQHKSFYSFHSVYEPYVMLFRQNAPFEILGISSKPMWIQGRHKGANENRDTVRTDFREAEESKDAEMLYVTSISWKSRGQRYHGYHDDVLFIGFGIEDANAGGIDVLAADLVKDMSLCSTL